MKKSTTILIWGLITSVVCVLYGVILGMEGLSISGLRYLNILLVFLGLFIGVRQYRDKANEGYLKFGEGYLASLLMTAIIMVTGVISLIITLQVKPDLPNELLNQLQVILINSGMDSDNIDKSMKYYSTYVFTPKGMIINAILGNIFIGAIVGLIAAGVNTKKKSIFDDSNEMPARDTPQA